MMKKMLCLFAAAGFLLAGSAAYADTCRVYGRVTQQDGRTPVSGATVTIRLSNLSRENVDFPWKRAVVKTDASGDYTAVFSFPPLRDIAFYIEVSKGLLYFDQFSDPDSGFVESPVNGASYRQNIKVLNGAGRVVIVKGKVHDIRTGRPVYNAPVVLYMPNPQMSWNGGYEELGKVFTDSDGSYSMVMRGDVSGMYKVECYYEQVSVRVPMRPGGSYQQDFMIQEHKDPGRWDGLVYGTVTDAGSGDPIPYAAVTTYEWYGGIDRLIHADFLGRYLAYTRTDIEYVYTYGVRDRSREPNSPYRKNLRSARSQYGAVLDFKMIRK